MENERDEKKGNGIFLGIVGVATLIVAIIGASLAYFSAQAASANSAIDLTAYEFNASLVMEPVYVPTETLIPVFPMGTVANVDEPNNKNPLDQAPIESTGDIFNINNTCIFAYVAF